MMNKRIQYWPLIFLALSLSSALPAIGYAEHDDGAAEKTGEKVDETVEKLRAGAKKGIDKARETVKETGEAIGEGAEKAADSIDGDGED